MQIKFKKLHPDAKMPTKKPNDAGYDLYSIEGGIINPFERRLFQTGIAVEIPKGFYGRVAPRSGLAYKSGIDILAGVIDNPYRDSIGVIMYNTNGAEVFYRGIHQTPLGIAGKYEVKPGDKIAQLIIENCQEVEFVEVEELSSSDRGTNGYGSSGR